MMKVALVFEHKRNLPNKIANNQLAVSIESHSQTIARIPQLLSTAVSREVEKGLKPANQAITELKDKLTESYGSMSKALENTAVQLLAPVRLAHAI